MITIKDKPNNTEDLRNLLHPYVREWFFKKFNDFSLSQLYGVMEVHSRNNILISAPTGGTKTLTSFLAILNELIDSSEKGILKDKVYCIYISPLKSLNNDIQKNLLEPLKEIEETAGKKFGIRVSVRTGDTSTVEKAKMLINPPHILISTPESLALMLNSIKFSNHIKNLDWCVIDECLPYDTLITLSDNKTIPIGTLVEDNLDAEQLISNLKKDIFVKTFDLKQKKIVNKKVIKVHKILNKRRMFRLNTKYFFSTLDLTENHPVAIVENNKLIWKKASQIKPGEKILILPNNEIYIFPKMLGSISLNRELFINNYLNFFQIKSKYGNNKVTKLNNSMKNLEKLGLLNIDYNSDKAFILSRLMGHLFGDGWLTITNKTCHLGFSGDAIDLDTIAEDINTLGFRMHSKSSRQTSSFATGIPIHGLSNQSLVCSKILAVFFYCLGLPRGDKTTQIYQLPKWIVNAPLQIKREFLAAYMGAEGMKPSQAKGKSFFYAPRFSMNKEISLIKNGFYFAEQLKTLFNEFNVDISSIIQSNGNIKKNGLVTQKVTVTIRNSEKNLLKFYNLVGFRYCKRKEILARLIGFYINAKFLARSNRLELVNKIKKLKKYGVSYSDIVLILGLEFYKGKAYGDKAWRIVDWITKPTKKNKSFLKNFPSFEFFSKNLIFEDFLVDEVSKVWNVNNTPKFVYDLTIEGNHNFLANNILVHNCHALAENKRGVHLSLSLERLQHLSPGMCRVGLSATIAPLNEIAQYLVGNRDCKVVDARFNKNMDIKVISPVDDLVNTAYDGINSEMYKIIDKLIQEHKTTVVFTNTRSGTERVVNHLKTKFPKNYTEITEDDPLGYKSLIGAHHGSLSKQHRLAMEEALRAGKLKAIVSSTSLELGLDIGYVDLVICLGSPKSIARLTQRTGRSNHTITGITKARVIAMDRDDLVECAVMAKDAIERNIDRIHIPTNCLDVLAQQINGMAIDQVWNLNEMYKLIKKSYCYQNLTRSDFDEVINYLAGEFASLEDRNVYAKIWKNDGKIGKRGKLGRVIYMTNIGTIPDETFVIVKVGDHVIGHIDEGFLEKLKPGDIFVLGGNTYEFKFARGMVAQVKSAEGKRPTIPSWFSETLPLSYDLALSIQKFRFLMEDKFKNKLSKKEILDFIEKYLYLDETTSEAVYNYFYEQYKYLEIPHIKKILVEHYIDEHNKYYLLFHTLYGRRVNDVFSRALAFAIGKNQNRDVEVGINDNGFFISCTQKVNALHALKLIKSNQLEEILKVALEKSEVLKRRFRHCAARAFMILRNYKGQTKRVGRQQVSSMILLNAVKKISNDFCILKEARREVLEDLMDIKSAETVLKEIELGNIIIKEVATRIPSPFAFTLIMQSYSDILKIEERHEFLRRMHANVIAKIALGR